MSNSKLSVFRTFLLRLGLILAVVFSFLSVQVLAKEQSTPKVIEHIPSIDEQFVVGKVLSVAPSKVNQELLTHTGMVSKQQAVTVQVLEGAYKGLKTKVFNEITDNPAYNINVKAGSEVILSIVSSNEAKPEVNISDYHRAPAIYYLGALFLVLFLLVGGKSGFKALLGLVISVLLIALVLLPLSLQGIYPLITAGFICFIATIASMLLIAGRTRKALASIIGTVCGVTISGFAAYWVIHYAPLTGLSSEEAQILRGSVLIQKAPFYSGLLAAGMLIGALGVIMDVAISIASTVYEVAQANKNLSMRGLYNSGMNVGRDIMGTMTNTLILAYAGGALPLLLLSSQMPWTKLLNLDLVATEVAAAISGSLGLVLTIPLTALASAWLMSRERLEDSQLYKHNSAFLDHEQGKRI